MVQMYPACQEMDATGLSEPMFTQCDKYTLSAWLYEGIIFINWFTLRYQHCQQPTKLIQCTPVWAYQIIIDDTYADCAAF